MGGLMGGHGVAGSGATEVGNGYSIGSVTGVNFKGGLIGNNSADGSTVTASFWDITSSGMATSAAGLGRSTATMQTPSSFTGNGWSVDTWILHSGHYPEIRSK